MAHFQRGDRPLDVAIIGAGMTGLALAIGLQRRGVFFTLYERAAALGGELGYGVGLSDNAFYAMSKLDERLEGILSWLPDMHTNRAFYYFDGFNEPDGDARNTAQERFFDVFYDDMYSDAARSTLLAEMARLIRRNRIKLGKELVSIRTKSNPVVLEFKDGSKAKADVVVGCDGIRSQVRHVMFGPGSRASYTHHVTFGGQVPMASARAALGDEKANRQTFHGGPNGLLITYPVRQGGLANVKVVGFAYDAAQWPGDKKPEDREMSDLERYTQTVTRSEALHLFRHFGPTVRTFVSLLPEKLHKRAIFDMFDRPVPSFVLGPLCLAGDAAHASSPYFQPSASMGVEDALMLAELLANVNSGHYRLSSSTMAKEALGVYNAKRYQRTMWVVASSRYVGELYQWRVPECANDKDKMKAEVRARQDRIHRLTVRFLHDEPGAGAEVSEALVSEPLNMFWERLKRL